MYSIASNSLIFNKSILKSLYCARCSVPSNFVLSALFKTSQLKLGQSLRHPFQFSFYTHRKMASFTDNKINTFQLVSDLHLEYYESEQIPNVLEFLTPSAENLIIAGDLGNPKLSSYPDFLRQCSKLFKRVFVVAGNHEFYNLVSSAGDSKVCMVDVLQEIHKLMKEFTNVHFLDNSSFESDNYVILGATLWTRIASGEKRYIEIAMNDYRLIFTSVSGNDENISTKETTNITKNLTVDDTNKLHDYSVKWLQQEIYKYKHKPVIIVTHHLISNKLVSKKWLNHPINSGFRTELDDELLKNNEQVKYVCSGHTHSSLDTTSNNGVTRLLVNPRGYKGDLNVQFNKQMTFSI